MNTTIYPLNPRDEDQPVLPEGGQAVLITLGIFFVMIVTTVVLLNYATAKDVQYSNLESDAASSDEMKVDKAQPADEVLSQLYVFLTEVEEENLPDLPDVDLSF